jgi:hypothetical protein
LLLGPPEAMMASGDSATNSSAYWRLRGIVRGPANVYVQVAAFNPTKFRQGLRKGCDALPELSGRSQEKFMRTPIQRT